MMQLGVDGHIRRLRHIQVIQSGELAKAIVRQSKHDRPEVLENLKNLANP